MELCLFGKFKVSELALPVDKGQMVLRVGEEVEDCLGFGEEDMLNKASE